MRSGIAARGLAIGYPGRPVLSGVDLELEAGELLAIIGPNGAGKTTLLKALAGELRPLAGQVSLFQDGLERPLSALGAAQRARRIARVLQSEEAAWPLPVREYVAAGTFSTTGWFGRQGEPERTAVREAMRSLDLEGLAGRPVTELSGGEFRRVLIARALAQSPSILLLDEPTSDLDLARQMETLGLLKRLAAEGRAVAFTVHDLNLAALAAGRVALVSGGAIAAIGSPREVITAENVSRAYGASVLVGDHPVGGHPQVMHAPAWLSGIEEELHG